MLSTVAADLSLALSHGAQAAQSTATTVLEDLGKPMAPTVSAPHFTVGSDVTASASGSVDPDGDAIGYAFRWCTASNGANRYVAARALTPTGWPQAARGPVTATGLLASISGDFVAVPSIGTFSKPAMTRYTWSGAESYCTNLVSGGVSDLRLPTRDELVALYNAYPGNR